MVDGPLRVPFLAYGVSKRLRGKDATAGRQSQALQPGVSSHYDDALCA